METSLSQTIRESNANTTRKRILIMALGSIVALLLLLGLLSFKVLQHFYAKAPNPVLVYDVDKSVKASISNWVPVEVEVNEKIPVKLSKVISVEIPFHKDVTLRIDDDFTIPVDATFSLPIDQEIDVQTEVPIEVNIPLDGTRIQTSLFGLKNITLPLSGSFPLKTVIPLHSPIHIKTQADVRINQDITVHVDKLLTLPLDLNLNIKLPIDDIFDVRLMNNFSVKGRIPEQIPVDVHVRLAVSKDGILTTD